MTTASTNRPGAAIAARCAVPAALALIVGAAYSRIFGQGFVSWDDPMNFTGNRYLDVATPAHLSWFWHHPYGGMYIPVSYTAFWLLSIPARAPDGQLDPHLFKAFNGLLHLANVLLVYGLLLTLCRRRSAAAAGALLFGLHPLQVESVAWASDIQRNLSASFGFAALLAYVAFARTRCWGWFAAALALGALGMLSKPAIVTIPLAALAIDRWMLGRSWRSSLPWCAVWLAAYAPLVYVAHVAEPVSAAYPLSVRPWIMLDSLGFYLAKLIVPWPLVVDYGRTCANLSLRSSPLAFFIAACMAVFVLRRRYPWLVGAALVGVAALLPVSGLVPFAYQEYSTVADRYAYVAMLGPALALSMALAGQGRKRIVAVGSIVVALCLPLTIGQIRVWDSSLALFRHCIRYAPTSRNAHLMLGFEYVAQRRVAEAGEEAMQARLLTERAPLKPDFGKVDELSGAIDVLRGDPLAAAASYRAAIAESPSSPNAYHALGMLLIQQGRAGEGLDLFRRALALDPTNPVLHVDLATALVHCNRPAAGLAELREAVRLDPDFHASRVNLVVLLCRLERYDEAAEQCRALIRLNGRDEAAHANLGVALLAGGRRAEAAGEFRRALGLVPSDETAREGLAASGG